MNKNFSNQIRGILKPATAVRWTMLKASIVLTCVIIAERTGYSDSIVIPSENRFTPGARSLTIPFRDTNQRWQQFYGSSQFDDAGGDLLRITEFHFRMDEDNLGESFSTIVRGLSIRMSTTDKDFNTASTTFADNHGSDLFVALPTSDVVLSGTKGTSFDVVVPLPNAYTYNRKSGNLAIDIRLSSSDAPFMDATSGQATSTFSVAGIMTFSTGTKTSAGLVTEVIYTVVPEPASLSLLLIGFACVKFIKSRNK